MKKNEKEAVFIALKCILECLKPVPLGDSVNYWDEISKKVKETEKLLEEKLNEENS